MQHVTRKALITGGSRGIGLAVAQALASQGYELLLVARHEVRLRDVAGRLQRNHSIPVKHFACDLSHIPSIDALCRFCRRSRFRPNLLVHNAGVFIEGSLTKSRTVDFEKTMAVNLRAVYQLTKGLLPLIAKTVKPRIIIIGSTAGLEPYTTGAVYGVSKWAVRGFAINLRSELLPRRIGVTLISPGGTLTDLWHGVRLPANRLLPPTDVARLVHAVDSLEEQTVVEEVVVRPILGDLHD